MKHFLGNIAVFALIVGLLTPALYFCSDYLVKSREQNLLKTGDKIHVLFSGDSNIECAINDSLVKNSLNIAQSGEAYLFTYEKIRSVCRYNNRITTIFLGFSYIDLLKSTEDRWMSEPGYVIEKIRHYNYLLNPRERTIILKNNPKAFFRGFINSIINNFTLYKKSFSLNGLNANAIHFGGYEYLTRDKLSEDIKQNQFKTLPPEWAFRQEKFLKLITDYCRKKSIKLILLNTPKFGYYNDNISDKIKQHWAEVGNSLFPDSLLDLSSMSFPDSCYSDLIHLNYRGARLFSDYLNRKIHSGALNEK